MIPGSSWGGSLANLLLGSSWQAIRTKYVESTGDKCKICGYPSHDGKSVDCHEIWEYYVPKQGGRTGIQKLVDILPVCKSCHEMFHLGKANADGRLNKVLNRLSWANRWNTHQIKEYYNYLGHKWLQRNEYMWMLDLSNLKLQTPIFIKGGDTGVKIEDGNLYFRTFIGEGVTRFLGVEFGHKGSTLSRNPVPSYDRYIKDV